jgi:hypothetical protein
MTIYGIVAALIAPTAVTGFGGFGFLGNGQQQSQARLQQDAANFGHQVLGVLLASLLLYIAAQILTGMLTVVIGRSVLGDRITAGQAWRRALPRLPAMLGATILYALTIAGVVAVYAGIGALVAVAAHGAGPALAVYLIVAGIAALCVIVWLWVSFMLVNQVVVLERAGPARALGRSWRLIRRSFWRVFGITLLAELIVAVASGILQLPFSIPAGLITAHAGSPLHPPVLAVVIGTVGTIISRTVTGAVLAGVFVLLYIDLRMRKEGLDMALRTAADGDRAAGDEFATVWRPPARSAQREQSAPSPGTGYPPGPPPGSGPDAGRW